MTLTADIIDKLRGATEELPIETLLFILQDGDVSCPFCKHRHQTMVIEDVFVCWRCKTSADAIGLIGQCEGIGPEEAAERYIELAEEHKGNH